MRSVLHALIWDNFRFFGWVQLFLLVVCMFPMGIYAIILSTAPSVEPADPVMFLLKVSMLPFVIFLLILSVGSGHTNTRQLYTKPISNLSIAAWRNIWGSLLIVIQLSFLVELHNRTFNAGWPLAGSVLFAVAMWMVAQPFFCLGGKTILGTLVTMIPIALMIVWWGTRFKPFGGGTRDWNEISSLEVLFLSAVTGLFAWWSVPCVGLARRGDGLPLPESIGAFFLRLFNWPLPSLSRDKPFRSPSSALFWYEWRWKGWGLLACMLLLLAVTLPVGLRSSFTIESYYEAVSAAYTGTIFPGMILAVLNGFQLESLDITAGTSRATQLNEIDDLRSFQAIRPVNDGVLGRRNLWVCLASVSLITALWFLLVVPVVIFMGVQGSIETFKTLETGLQLFNVPLVGLFMWVCTSNLTALTSTGRTKQFGGCFIALMLTFAGLLFLLEWLNDKALSRTVLQSLLLIVTISLVALAGWAYARAWQLGFLSRAGASIQFCIAATFFGLGLWWLPVVNANSVAGLLCGSVLCVLPWATTPLATRWNRHR